MLTYIFISLLMVTITSLLAGTALHTILLSVTENSDHFTRVVRCDKDHTACANLCLIFDLCFCTGVEQATPKFSLCIMRECSYTNLK